MGKPKNKGMGVEGGGEEEEEEKARPAGEQVADISTAKSQGEAGMDPASALALAPAPRKRGRPRKVAVKVEENTALLPQKSAAMAIDVENKKQKAESPSSTRNGNPSNEHSLTSSKLSTRAPLRREGSRRKSEPRRAAD